MDALDVALVMWALGWPLACVALKAMISRERPGTQLVCWLLWPLTGAVLVVFGLWLQVITAVRWVLRRIAA